MGDADQALHCYVSGRVQGVFFRASTKEKAQALGLTGYARNLPDGRVEIVACGARARLNLLETWLTEGPPNAEVSSVECQAASPRPFSEFSAD